MSSHPIQNALAATISVVLLLTGRGQPASDPAAVSTPSASPTLVLPTDTRTANQDPTVTTVWRDDGVEWPVGSPAGDVAQAFFEGYSALGWYQTGAMYPGHAEFWNRAQQRWSYRQITRVQAPEARGTVDATMVYWKWRSSFSFEAVACVATPRLSILKNGVWTNTDAVFQTLEVAASYIGPGSTNDLATPRPSTGAPPVAYPETNVYTDWRWDFDFDWITLNSEARDTAEALGTPCRLYPGRRGERTLDAPLPTLPPHPGWPARP